MAKPHALAKSILLTGAAVMAGASVMDLSRAAPPPRVVVQRMDQDGDGRISADEWIKPLKAFKRIDANNDGYVTAKEIEAFRKKRNGSRVGETPGAAPAVSATALAGNGEVPAKDGWVDVHFHLIADTGDLDGFDRAARKAIGVMDKAGIGKIIAMPPPRPRRNFDVESLKNLAEKYAARIAFMGGGGSLNPMIQAAGHSSEVSDELREEFKGTAQRILASGAKGFGEITAHHVSLHRSHGYERVPADHPLLLLLADIAAQHDVPIDMHFDPVPKDAETPSHLDSPQNPPLLEENIKAFERLLGHNRGARIVWAHAGSDPVGWYTPKLVDKMLKKHPNLYFSIRPVNKPRTKPVWNPKDGINRAWTKVFKKHPDRFVLGTDSFVVSESYSGRESATRAFEGRTVIQREGVNKLLSALDDDLTYKISRANAERIYRLQ